MCLYAWQCVKEISLQPHTNLNTTDGTLLSSPPPNTASQLSLSGRAGRAAVGQDMRSPERSLPIGHGR